MLNKEHMLEKDRLIEKLYSDIKDMHIRMERVTQERNDAVEKFSQSEKYWRQKVQKQERENESMSEMTHQLKDDNHSLLIQIDKFGKRIKALEGELQRELDSHKSKDTVIADINR